MDTDTKYIFGYCILLIIGFAMFIGHEMAIIRFDLDRKRVELIGNNKLKNCQRVLAGSMFDGEMK